MDKYLKYKRKFVNQIIGGSVALPPTYPNTPMIQQPDNTMYYLVTIPPANGHFYLLEANNVRASNRYTIGEFPLIVTLNNNIYDFFSLRWRLQNMDSDDRVYYWHPDRELYRRYSAQLPTLLPIEYRD